MPAAQRSLAIGWTDWISISREQFHYFISMLKTDKYGDARLIRLDQVTHRHDYDKTRIKILGTPRPCLFVFYSLVVT